MKNQKAKVATPKAVAAASYVVNPQQKAFFKTRGNYIVNRDGTVAFSTSQVL